MPIRKVHLPSLIATDDDVRRGVRALRRKCPAIRLMHDVTGDPPLRRNEAGFAGLARIIVSQQVSVASATAIWTRLAVAVQPMDAAVLLALSDDELRAAGLSRPKVRTLRALATALAVDGMPLDELAAHDDDGVHQALTGISGIGPWTADIFLLFCLGRADAFAAGDLALQEAARLALNLDARPNPVELRAIAERWRPWRGVAARLLWAYYATQKAREGVNA